MKSNQHETEFLGSIESKIETLIAIASTAKQWARFVSNYDMKIDFDKPKLSDWNGFLNNKRCQINLTPCHHVFGEGLFFTAEKWKRIDKFTDLE